VDSPESILVAVLEAAGFRKTGEHAHSVNFRHPSGEPVQVSSDAGFDAMIARAQRLEMAGGASAS
jgi:hypothetical protein